MNQPQQQPQQKTDNSNVIVLLAGDEVSNRRLRAAANAKFPGAQIVERYPIARFVNLHKVYVVINEVKETYDEEKMTVSFDNQGIRFAGPVSVADHWQQTAGGDFQVKLNTFLGALGPQIVPKQANSRAIQEGYIRIGDV